MTTYTAEMIELNSQVCAKPRTAMGSLMLVCVLSALVGRCAYLYEPFNGDGAMFAYMGKLTAEGGRFADDLIDNKFPTVGLVTSIFWKAFGTWWPGYVIAQTVMAFGAAVMLARAAGRAFGEESRRATFLVAIVLMNLNAAVMGGFQLETIQTFFACIAAACALENLRGGDWRDALVCGMAAGCAVLVKPTGGAVLVALIAGTLTPALCCHGDSSTRRTGRGRMLKSWLGAIFGFMIPICAAVWYLLASDQLTLIPEIARQLSDYAANTSFDVWDLYRPISLLFLFGMAMLIRGWVYRRRSIESVATGSVWVFAIAWLMIEFIGVVMQRRMYAYHFLPLAGPAALVFGALPRRTTVGQMAGVLAIPVLLSFWGAVYTIQLAQEQPPTWPAVTSWLKDHCAPRERIWRDQTMYVLLHSDLRPASRLQLTFLFMNSDNAPQHFAGILLDELGDNRPRYIVLPASVDAHIHKQTTQIVELARIPHRRENFTMAWHQIQSFVESRYDLIKTIGEEGIWQRRE